MEEIATIPVHPAFGRVYAEGWQSWSPAWLLPVSAPPGRFEGSGLLAIDPGNDAPPVMFGAHSAAEQVPLIEAVLREDRLIVSADGPVVEATDSGPFGLLGALGRWGERFAERAAGGDAGGSPAARVIPAVWCSWYQYYERVTAADVSHNLGRIMALDLPADVIQVDDGWQAAAGDWLTIASRFGDLRGLARQISDMGRRPGIWIAPWLVGRSSELYRSHRDWLVRDAGSPDDPDAPDEPVSAGHVVRDECAALDLTVPAAAEYLTEVLHRLRDWGFSYFKVDFSYAGACEGRRHVDMPGVAAYRAGMALIRSAIGPESVLLGCGAPLLPSVSVVDAMRIGPDIAATWEPSGTDEAGSLSAPCQRNASRNVIARAWQHGRLWVSDPDCLMLRPSVERREDWASLVARYGGLRASSDGIDELDEWGLEQTRSLLGPASPEPVTPS